MSRTAPRHAAPPRYARTRSPCRAEKPARRFAPSGWPQIAKKPASVSLRPFSTSITPVGVLVLAAYEHDPATTCGLGVLHGGATPIPAGTRTTRPRANSSTWTPNRRRLVRSQRRRPIFRRPTTGADRARGWNFAPAPIGVGIRGFAVAPSVANTRVANTSAASTANAVQAVEATTSIRITAASPSESRAAVADGDGDEGDGGARPRLA